MLYITTVPFWPLGPRKSRHDEEHDATLNPETSVCMCVCMLVALCSSRSLDGGAGSVTEIRTRWYKPSIRVHFITDTVSLRSSAYHFEKSENHLPALRGRLLTPGFVWKVNKVEVEQKVLKKGYNFTRFHLHV